MQLLLNYPLFLQSQIVSPLCHPIWTQGKSFIYHSPKSFFTESQTKIF